MTTEIVVVMGVAEAELFTSDLRRDIARTAEDVEEIKRRLADAEEREVWKVLGYRSMGRYVSERLGMARSNAYRTLDQVHASLALVETVQATVPRGTVLRHNEKPVAAPAPSQREAVEVVRPKRAQKAAPGFDGWLRAIRDNIQYIEGAFDMAEGNVLDYLTSEQRRDLERTVTKAYEWSSELAERLA